MLELLNKNKSLDFEALRAFALEDYWSRDKVATRKNLYKSTNKEVDVLPRVHQREMHFFFFLETTKIISSCDR